MNVTIRRVSRQRWHTWLGLLAYLAVSLPVFGAEVNLPDATELSSHGITEADLSGLDKIMTDFINKGTISGCSFLVAHKGEVVYRRAHGRFTTDEQVPLASVSKPFAASVIMALAEQGKLDLEHPVEKYLPEFKGIRVKGSETPARPMTIRHVLSHMAGFWGNKGITREKTALIRDFSQTLEESAWALRSTNSYTSLERNGHIPGSGIAWRAVSRKPLLATSRSRRSPRTPCFGAWA